MCRSGNGFLEHYALGTLLPPAPSHESRVRNFERFEIRSVMSVQKAHAEIMPTRKLCHTTHR
jgi:hypothetical protein